MSSGIDHLGLAEALKQQTGDAEGAKHVRETVNEYLDFRDSVALRRTLYSPKDGITPPSSPPGSPQLKPCEGNSEGVPGGSTSASAPDDPDEYAGKALVVQGITQTYTYKTIFIPPDINSVYTFKALAMDEAGRMDEALLLYIKGVEQYLRFLERETDAENVARLVGEVPSLASAQSFCFIDVSYVAP